MIGGKTGYTSRAQRCFVGAAQRDEKTLLVCVLGSKDHFEDAARLLDYGFAGTIKKDRSWVFNQQQAPSSAAQGYVLQVGSFSQFGNALDLNRNLTTNGYPSFIEDISHKGLIYHRVKVGYYQDLSAAKKTKKNIRKYFKINPLILYQKPGSSP